MHENATLTGIPYAVANATGGAPCIQNIEALGPPTQWGSPFCVVDTRAMAKIYRRAQGGRIPLLRVETQLGPPGLRCTLVGH